MKAKIVAFHQHYAPLIKMIRQAVFIEEQGIDVADDFDGLDEKAIHFLVFDDAQKPAGTGRILDDGHIGRLAVLKAFRNNGVGRLALDSLIREAKRQGLQRVYLSAQLQAMSFYNKAGFKRCSEVYQDVGIPHVDMKKWL